MSQVRGITWDMRNPPPELPDQAPELSAIPALLPLLPLLPPFPGQQPFPGPPLPGAPCPGRPGRPRPLPDAIAVYRIPLPESAPPYDDDQATGQLTAAGGPPTVDSRGRPAVTDAGAGEWAGQFAQALAETLAGSRSSRQLTPWTTEQARRRIRQLGPLLQAGQRPRVRRVITSVPARDVVEMTVIVGIGPRIRAMAVRLERTGPAHPGPGCERHWLCTAIEAA
jgi:Family of unknown function (DUF6459)